MTTAERPCPACEGAGDLLSTLSLHEQHLAYTGGDERLARQLDAALAPPQAGCQLLRCRACRLEYADPPPCASADWYTLLYRHLDLYPGQRWEYGEVASALRPGDSVVDYGCGSGHFLASVQPRVQAAAGFDFSAASVAAARERGLDAHRLDLAGGLPEWRDAVDHVTAFHVLEHLVDPAQLFRFAHHVARPTATLWIAVPSDRRASRVHGEADVFDAPPHHLTRWTEASLREAAQRGGWLLQQHLYEPLSVPLAVWETTRRLPLYRRLNPPTRPLQWLLRRTLAAGVWARGRHRATAMSGFSMLARFSRTTT
jgi:SAM-dependent methyltransferase